MHSTQQHQIQQQQQQQHHHHHHSPSFQHHYELNDLGQKKLFNKHGSSDSINVVQEILCDQDLSRAGNLFTMSNDVLLKNFPRTLDILKAMIDSRKYVNNLNEQSIVEIVLTRCISALRETKMIVNYYDDLLELLEICLKYNLNHRYSYRNSVIGDYDGDKINGYNNNTTPHANIVSDILSSILLDYLDPELSMKAVPVCIKLLQHHNIKRELLREICSYLNLVACRSPELLVDYIYYIVNAIFKGNTCLSRLLFQICEAKIDCIYPLTKHLIKTLKTIESSEDLINILKIMYMISLNHVQLIIVHLEDLIGFLADDVCQDYILDILFSIASQVPIALEPFMCLFDKSSFYENYKVDKIISMIGKSLKSKSEQCANLLIQRIKTIQQKTSKTNSLSNRNQTNRLSKRLSQITANGIIIDGNDAMIEDEIYASKQTSAQQHRASSYRKSNSYSYAHGYRAGDADSDDYQTINTRTNAAENETKRCLQILGEFYAIATVHPQVLDTCFKPVSELYQNPSDNVKLILERLKDLQSSSRICSTNHMDSASNQNLDTVKSFEQSLDSIENFRPDPVIVEPPTTTTVYTNQINKREKEEVENDYEVIKKEDENSSMNSFGAETSNIPLIDENSVKQEDETKTVETSEYNNNMGLNVVINESITFSLLNTKIAEEPECEEEEEEDEENGNDEGDEKRLLSKETGPFKQSHNPTDLRSMSFREPNNDNYRQFNNASSFSYSSRAKDESFLTKDLVQQFCEKHQDKVKNYIKNISQILPMPSEDCIINQANFNNYNTLETNRQNFFSKKFKNKKFCTVNFTCQRKHEYCLYSKNSFEIITFYPTIWIHIMFLSIQSKLPHAISQNDLIFISLKNFYERLNEKTTFVALVTSSFPSEKQIKELSNELKELRFFNLFENSCCANEEHLNEAQLSPTEDCVPTQSGERLWQCYFCANPERIGDLIYEKPLIQGQLKEKHGKWKFLRRWRKRLYTLTGGNIVYFKKDMRQEILSVRYITSIQTLKSSKTNKKSIPKAFEIFTDTNSFILKAQNSRDAEEWIQYLQLSKAVENSRFALLNQNYSTLLKNSL